MAGEHALKGRHSNRVFSPSLLSDAHERCQDCPGHYAGPSAHTTATTTTATSCRGLPGLRTRNTGQAAQREPPTWGPTLGEAWLRTGARPGPTGSPSEGSGLFRGWECLSSQPTLQLSLGSSEASLVVVPRCWGSQQAESLYDPLDTQALSSKGPHSWSRRPWCEESLALVALHGPDDTTALEDSVSGRLGGAPQLAACLCTHPTSPPQGSGLRQSGPWGGQRRWPMASQHLSPSTFFHHLHPTLGAHSPTHAPSSGPIRGWTQASERSRAAHQKPAWGQTAPCAS